MTNNEPYISHGRGGAANLTKDSTVYADAGITREGPVGDQGDGPYSSGRGGTGNIDGVPHHHHLNRSRDGTPQPGAQAGGPQAVGHHASAPDAIAQPPAHTETGDRDYIPEQSVREAPDNYHVGRGGEGNVIHESTEKGEKVHVHEGAAERLRQKIFGKPGKP